VLNEKEKTLPQFQQCVNCSSNTGPGFTCYIVTQMVWKKLEEKWLTNCLFTTYSWRHLQCGST